MPVPAIRFTFVVAAVAIFVLRAPVSAEPRRERPEDACADDDGFRWPPELTGRLQEPFAVVDGTSFYRTPLELRAFRLELQGRRRLARACPAETLRSQPTLTVVLRVSSADYPQSAQLVDSAEDLWIVHHALGNASPGGVTVDEVAAAVARTRVDVDPAAAAFMFNYLFATDRDQVLRSARGNLSMAQIVVATQYLGYLAGSRFDFGKQDTLHRDVRTPSQVADAAAAELAGDHPERTAGTCADIANAQGELLQKLGAKDAVVVTGALLSGLHSTVIARDPRRQTYFQFNYDMVSQSSRREGPNLIQVPDSDGAWTFVGPGLYLNRPNGRTVAYVPSEVGKVYAEAAGMDIREIEPLARATSSLVGARLALPWDQSVQTFLARDASGSFSSGLGLTQSWAPGGSFPGAAGLVVAARRLPQGLSVADVYLQIEQHGRTPALAFGRWLRGQLDGTLILIGSYSVPFQSLPDTSLGFDAALVSNTGAQLTAATPGSRFVGRARVDVQLLPGVANVGGATPTVFVNQVSLSVDGRTRLGHVGAAAVDLIGGHAVIADSFGARLALGIGVESSRLAIRIEATGRASANAPTYKEGSLRRGRISIASSITRFLRLSCLGEVQEAASDPWWTLTGALDAHF